MSLLRPILKGTPTAESHPGIPSFRGGHVHFPPTPEISATFLAHSAKIYDRSAIVVSPNLCALPTRHCPERTYVLSEGKSEARLLKSVQLKGLQRQDENDEDAEDTDDDSCGEYDHTLTRIDYFSISSTPETFWAESDDSDELLSLHNDVTSHCGHSQIPMLEVSLHGTHTRGASESHEHVQATLSFLHHTLPPAHERKRHVSLHDRERLERAHTFSGGECNHCAPIARLRRPRRASSFTTDVPSDLGCLGGF